MNNLRSGHQSGFVLIVTMLVLIVLTILVLNAVRASTINEQVAGSYMDRNRAMQAAEQALRQGQELLLNNGEACLAGCSFSAGVASPSLVQVAMPAAWPGDNGKTDVTLATGQGTSASFQIAQLQDALRAADKTACKAYSIMGRGVGLDARTSVMLQTVAYVCELE